MIALTGTDRIAYRDPAAVWFNGECVLYFTFVESIESGTFLRIGESRSRDLVHWSGVRILTPRDKSLNYSSPGCVVKDGGEYVLCLQTYCRENGEKYGNERSRLFTMRSVDLEKWSEPELLRVKGDAVPEEDMGRMIDPYLLYAKGAWWCFFKQNGIGISRSEDLRSWEFLGNTQAGENPCVIPYKDGFRMFSSPDNGIRVMDSADLIHWKKVSEDITLGQSRWPWAMGRLTAGFVLRNPENSGFPRYTMFFHGSRYPESLDFDANASIGIAFSENLEEWTWRE